MHRVSFDYCTEYMVILHPFQGHGDCFKFLDCMIEIDLRIYSVIDQILGKIRSIFVLSYVYVIL